MNNRIREIRKDHSLTQAEFGERIAVKANTVTGYENGLRTPSDAIIFSICREFNVNEDWLRTGEGEKYLRFSRKDTVAAYVGKILGGKVTPLEATLIEFMAETSAEEWEELARILKRFTDTITAPENEKEEH